MQESQDTGYPNDLPVKSYDFYGAIGQFGQVHAHYHLLRKLHMMMNAWGSNLIKFNTTLPPYSPPTSDTTNVRWAVRSLGMSGLMFVNNYARLTNMTARTDVRFGVTFDTSLTLVPSAVRPSLTIPANSYFVSGDTCNVNLCVTCFACVWVCVCVCVCV